MVNLRIEVDREVCIGDKACCEEAPATFILDEEMKVIVRDPPRDPLENLLAAARCCPMEAIRLLDRDSGRQIWPH
jgi:ferredoxin